MRFTSLTAITLLFSVTSGRLYYDPPTAQHIRSSSHKHVAKRTSFLHDLKVTFNELTRSRRSSTSLEQASSSHLQKRSPGGGKGDQCVLKPPLSGGAGGPGGGDGTDVGVIPTVTVTLTNTRHVDATPTKTTEVITTTRKTTTVTTTVESTPTPTSPWKVKFSHVSPFSFFF
jgi:hypothetical protein